MTHGTTIRSIGSRHDGYANIPGVVCPRAITGPRARRGHIVQNVRERWRRPHITAKHVRAVSVLTRGLRLATEKQPSAMQLPHPISVKDILVLFS